MRSRHAVFLLLFIVSCAVAAEATTRPARAGPIYAPDGPSSGRIQSAEPLVLTPGPRLFLNDYLIESSRNTQRRPITLQRDAMIANPIITGARPDGGDKNFLDARRRELDPRSGPAARSRSRRLCLGPCPRLGRLPTPCGRRDVQ